MAILELILPYKTTMFNIYKCFHHIFPMLFLEQVGGKLKDMHQEFRTKAHQFAEQLVGEVFASKKDVPPMPTQLAQPAEVDSQPKPDMKDPHAYRDESRVSEYGELNLKE